MSNEQSTALRIADRLDAWGDQGDLLEASAMLRQQHATLQQALEALEFIPARGSMLGGQAEAKRVQTIAAIKGRLK